MVQFSRQQFSTHCSLELLKIDAGDEEKVLDNVEFLLTGIDETSTEGLTYTATTDALGLAEWSELVPGQYVITEEVSHVDYSIDSLIFEEIEGLEKDGDNWIVTIEADDDIENPLKLTAKNSKIVPESYTGGLSIYKYDKEKFYEEDGTGILVGVEFLLEGDDATTAGISLPATTGVDGEAYWENLTPGAYKLSEIKAIDDYSESSFNIEYPEGYVKDGDGKYSIIIENDKILNLEATNEKEDPKLGGLVLYKMDEKDGFALEGAQFYLEGDKTDNNTQDYFSAITTDDEGKAEWKNLEPGKYLLYEISPPKDYDPNTFKILTANGAVKVNNEIGYSVTIEESEDGEPQVLIATNKKDVEGEFKTSSQWKDGEKDQPKTSDSANMMLIVFMILALAGAVGGFVAQRRLNEAKK